MAGEGRFIDNLMKGDLVVTGSVKESDTKKYCYEDFKSIPVCQVSDATSALPSGTAQASNVAKFEDNTFLYSARGTQTIIGIGSQAATGCDVGGDQTANDGREICFSGGVTARAPRVYTVGSAFFARLKFSIADVSGTDECAFGFRKAEAAQAAIDGYDEMAVLNVISGNINIETILNNAATVTTDTGEDWADGATHELRVDVAADGAVTYKIDGDTPTTVAAFSFDAGEDLIPFFFFLHDTDLAGAITLIEFESSYV